MKKKPPLSMFEAKQFKAIRDSGKVKFGWLTCLIGDNGVGKSSLIEALETFRDIVVDDLDSAMIRWKGFEHVWNKSPERTAKEIEPGQFRRSHPMQFSFAWDWAGDSFRGEQFIAAENGFNNIAIYREKLTSKINRLTEIWTRHDDGRCSRAKHGGPTESHEELSKIMRVRKLEPGESLFEIHELADWQFLSMNADAMGNPVPQRRASSRVRLNRDGSNVAAYLNEIRELDLNAFDGILQSLSYVLPYATDLQPKMTSELERAVYLNLKESDFEVPGWLLSSGTLRFVALLACLRHPNPPPLLVIEEIENGLDPRTLALLVEEFRAAGETGATQIVLTTHSPYLLDLLDLSHLIVVEREDGEPRFNRPDEKALESWANDFSPGRLYTMGRLAKRDGNK
ncbi:MAG: AAA family ATPase [Candidatus Paceibacterota bacterium]